MNKRKTLVAVATLPLLLLAASPGAQAQGYWPWGAFAAGAVTGLVVGAAIARPPVYGYPAPAYGVPPPYGVYGPPASVIYSPGVPGYGPPPAAIYGPPPRVVYAPPPRVIYAPPPPVVVYRGYGGW